MGLTIKTNANALGPFGVAGSGEDTKKRVPVSSAKQGGENPYSMHICIIYKFFYKAKLE